MEQLKKNQISELAEIARRTESFRDYCETLLASSTKASTAKAKLLLEDDRELLVEIQHQISTGRRAYFLLLEVIRFLANMYHASSPADQATHRSCLETEVILQQQAHDLQSSAIFDEFETLLQQDTSINNILPVVNQWVAYSQENALSFHGDIVQLRSLILSAANGLQNSISESNAHSSAKNKASPISTKTSSTKKAKSTDLATECMAILDSMSARYSFDKSKWLLHEAYALSTRSVRFKQYVEPNPRTAIERALTSPGDYLGCDCCPVSSANAHYEVDANGDSLTSYENGTRSSTGHAPSASALFTLLQEAPTIINVRDLFDAFQSRVDNGVENQNMNTDTVSLSIMTRFYRSLAELKMLGLVKESTGTQIKRKTKNARAGGQDADFVAKTSWAGL